MLKINRATQLLHVMCGVVAPMPFFIDVGAKLPILEIFYISQYKASSSGAVPLGYFFLVLVVTLILWEASKVKVVSKSEICEIIFYLVWVIFLLFYVPIPRVISISSLFFIAILLKIGVNNGISFRGMALGYLYSLVFILAVKIHDTHLCGFLICSAIIPDLFLGLRCTNIMFLMQRLWL